MSRPDSNTNELRDETRELFKGLPVSDEFMLNYQKRADQYSQEYREDLIKLFRLEENEPSKAAS